MRGERGQIGSNSPSFKREYPRKPFCGEKKKGAMKCIPLAYMRGHVRDQRGESESRRKNLRGGNWWREKTAQHVGTRVLRPGGGALSTEGKKKGGPLPYYKAAKKLKAVIPGLTWRPIRIREEKKGVLQEKKVKSIGGHGGGRLQIYLTRDRSYCKEKKLAVHFPRKKKKKNDDLEVLDRGGKKNLLIAMHK